MPHIFSRREFLEISTKALGYMVLKNRGGEFLQFSRPQILIDPAIPSEKGAEFENLANSWVDKAFKYYPTVQRNADLMANYRIIAYQNGNSVFNILPPDSGFVAHPDVYTPDFFEASNALTQSTDVVFHVGNDVDVNSETWQNWICFEFGMGVIANLLQSTPNTPPFNPAWMAEGLAFMMHNDIPYGVDNWSIQQSVNSVLCNPVNRDLSAYEDRSAQVWADEQHNAYDLAFLSVVYLTSLSTGRTDAGLQLIEKIGQGQTFDQALANQAKGITRGEFYSGFSVWLTTQIPSVC